MGWRGVGKDFLLSSDSHLQLLPDVVLVVGELSRGTCSWELKASWASGPRRCWWGCQQEPRAASSFWDNQDQGQWPRSPRPQGRAICSGHSWEGSSPKRAVSRASRGLGAISREP